MILTCDDHTLGFHIRHLTPCFISKWHLTDTPNNRFGGRWKQSVNKSKRR